MCKASGLSYVQLAAQEYHKRLHVTGVTSPGKHNRETLRHKPQAGSQVYPNYTEECAIFFASLAGSILFLSLLIAVTRKGSKLRARHTKTERYLGKPIIGAVGVDAVVPDRVALDEQWRVHGQRARAGHSNNNGAAATDQLRLRPLHPL